MPDDETAGRIPTASKTPPKPDYECTCLAYTASGSPSAFDVWTVDLDPYGPQHGTESGDEA